MLEAKSLSPLKNIWVALHEVSIIDSQLFKKTPEFVAKTNLDGYFVFPNLPNEKKYEVYAFNKTKYFYDKTNVAFSDNSIETGIDTFTELFSFNSSLLILDILSSKILIFSTILETLSNCF